MRFENYNAQKIEPQILNFWQTQRIVEKLRERNLQSKPFYFLEGPPYTSGRVHIGTAWQTSMKDIVLRYKRMKGFNVWDRMGYDMHGLPTEQKVMKKFNLKNKEDIEKYGLEKFTMECKLWCQDMMLKMNQDFIRLGITMDFTNPYQPISNHFMEAEWWLIKRAHEKKRLYQGLRTMHWDAATQSSVAKHELEYKNIKDTSIFMKFPYANENNKFFIIWTTTPWTIPLNLAIMVNPELKYVEVQVNEQIWVIAENLLGLVMQKAQVEKFCVISTFKGADLAGIKYTHPLNLVDHLPEELQNNPKLYTVLLSCEYVDDTAGTGLVHCAPGCGPEDYEVGHLNNIAPFNCVNEEGIFENLGKFTGWKAKTDDSKFIAAFEKADTLIAKESYVHEYPHGERSHEPVIFRTTKQWFFKVEDLKDKMLQANQNITWNPTSAKNGFNGWLENLRDNSITKQRYWGTPVPIWQADDGDFIVVGNLPELEELSGQKVTNMHIPHIDKVIIKRNGKTYTRIPDVLDVWIDAGTASWNCLDYPKNKENFDTFFPADFILEGKDQIRGWFNLLMVASFLAFDKAPFKNVYMNGFVTDVDGVKMSKSIGNIIAPDKLIEKHGADVLRYYMFQTAAGVDINFSWDECIVKQRQLNILWNVHKLLINSAAENEIELSGSIDKPTKHELNIEEKYIISKCNSTIKEVTHLLESYKLDQIIAPIEDLFLELSRTYIQMVRDKLSLGTIKQKETVLTTINLTLMQILKMFNLISPFISEAIFLNLKDEFAIEEESISHYIWPSAKFELIDEALEQEMIIVKQIIQAGLYAREKAKLGLRWPIIEMVITTNNTLSEPMQNIILKQLNAKSLKIMNNLSGIKSSIKPNLGKIGPTFAKDSKKVIELINNANEEIIEKICNQGSVNLDGLNITSDMVHMEHIVPKQYCEAQFKSGYVYIDTQTNEELLAEGYSREVMRKVQSLRKDAELQRLDQINLKIIVSEEMIAMLEKFAHEIKEKVGAVELEFGYDVESSDNSHKFSIKSEEFIVEFDRV